MAGRPRYTEGELQRYFARVCLPAERRLLSRDVQGLPAAEKLAHLALLMKHQVIRVPFENLTLHYSWHRTIDVSPRHLYRKIVGEERSHPNRKSRERAEIDAEATLFWGSSGAGRGGYCMEVNSFFHTVLLSLGYDVYMAGARVYQRETGTYGGFSHCVNIVTLGRDARYVVDVGFGSNGPVRPIPLPPPAALGLAGELLGPPEEHPHISPASVRLLHEPIPQQTNQDCRVWIYQHRPDPAADWVPMYCFVDIEFLLEDIRGMNFQPWRSPRSFFTRKILMTRFTTDKEAEVEAEESGDAGAGSGGGGGPGSPDESAITGAEIDGIITLFENTLKWRRRGDLRLELKFENEQQRVDALRGYFGIELDEEDRDAIRGTVAEISDSW